VTAVCVDMWEPFRLSLKVHLPRARLIYDKFHVLKHANAAVDETRRPSSSGRGAGSGAWCGASGWLLLTPVGEPGPDPAADPDRPLRGEPPPGQGVPVPGIN